MQLGLSDTHNCTAKSNIVTVSIWTDNCDGLPNFYPGTQVGQSVSVTIAPDICMLTTADFRNAGVTLSAGARYWVVVQALGQSKAGTNATWWMSNASLASTMGPAFLVALSGNRALSRC